MIEVLYLIVAVIVFFVWIRMNPNDLHIDLYMGDAIILGVAAVFVGLLWPLLIVWFVLWAIAWAICFVNRIGKKPWER